MVSSSAFQTTDGAFRQHAGQMAAVFGAAAKIAFGLDVGLYLGGNAGSKFLGGLPRLRRCGVEHSLARTRTDGGADAAVRQFCGSAGQHREVRLAVAHRLVIKLHRCLFYDQPHQNVPGVGALGIFLQGQDAAFVLFIITVLGKELGQYIRKAEAAVDAAAHGRQIAQLYAHDMAHSLTHGTVGVSGKPRVLFQLAAELKEETGCHITFINLSGGVGIPYRPDQTENDIMAIGEGVRLKFEEMLVPAGLGDVAIFSEMGRFTTGPYGALVSTVIHEKHIYKEYIGLDACAANLMRPAMYGAYHHITVLGKENEPCDHKYDVVGGLCENNDKFAVDRMLPEIDIGDILYIHDTGAHGSAMGYNYNGKLHCAEVLLCEDGSHRLIRRAQTPRDYFATLDFLPFMKPLFED